MTELGEMKFIGNRTGIGKPLALLDKTVKDVLKGNTSVIISDSNDNEQFKEDLHEFLLNKFGITSEELNSSETFDKIYQGILENIVFNPSNEQLEKLFK